MKTAIDALAALAHETRLSVFRLLVVEGPDGIAAGGIAERLSCSASTLSFHLAHLERAGLLAARREGKQILYSVDHAGMRDLLDFLMKDCCGGNPAICAPLSGGDARSPVGCAPGTSRT